MRFTPPKLLIRIGRMYILKREKGVAVMDEAAPSPMSVSDVAKQAETIPGLIEDLIAGDIEAMKTFMELSGQKIASITVTPVKG